MAMNSSLSSNIIVSTTDAVNIVSYNMHGFNQGILELKSLCQIEKYDIIFIQEHWLSSDQLSNFDYFKNDYCVYCTSAMDSTLVY